MAKSAECNNHTRSPRKGSKNLAWKSIAIVGAGRTDTGVHAAKMYAHFDFDAPIDLSHLAFKLNAYLPKDIAISKIHKVKDNAHARFDAKSRTYHYKVSTQKDVFLYDYAYQLTKALDLNVAFASFVDSTYDNWVSFQFLV